VCRSHDFHLFRKYQTVSREDAGFTVGNNKSMFFALMVLIMSLERKILKRKISNRELHQYCTLTVNLKKTE
jgi:hypothetical protein